MPKIKYLAYLDVYIILPKQLHILFIRKYNSH